MTTPLEARAELFHMCGVHNCQICTSRELYDFDHLTACCLSFHKVMTYHKFSSRQSIDGLADLQYCNGPFSNDTENFRMISRVHTTKLAQVQPRLGPGSTQMYVMFTLQMITWAEPKMQFVSLHKM